MGERRLILMSVCRIVKCLIYLANDIAGLGWTQACSTYKNGAGDIYARTLALLVLLALNNVFEHFGAGYR